MTDNKQSTGLIPKLFLKCLLITVFSSQQFVHCLFLSSFLHPNLNTSVVHRTTPFNPNSPFTSSFNILSMSLRAWTCHGRNQKDMVDKLTSAGIIKTAPVKEALTRVNRANYVENPASAYMDAPQSIGFGQTISAPHMHAHALEEILPTLTRISNELKQETSTGDKEDKELKILDVGCGSGYLTAAFGYLVNRGAQGTIHPFIKGRVWGIDVVPELVTMSRENLMKADKDLLDSGTVTFAIGDGWRGLPENGPFHAIHVGAAAESFPRALMMQLYPHGGVMVIPVGANNSIQNLYRVERLRDNKEYRSEDFHIQNLLGVRYVPLVHTNLP